MRRMVIVSQSLNPFKLTIPLPRAPLPTPQGAVRAIFNLIGSLVSLEAEEEQRYIQQENSKKLGCC